MPSGFRRLAPVRASEADGAGEGRRGPAKPMTDLRDLYQQVIIQHSRSPRNFKKLEGANRTAKGNNPLCGDRLTVYLELEDDRVLGVSFEGSGCAISRASASLMTESVKGKTLDEVRELFDDFRDMVTRRIGEEVEEEGLEGLGKLAVFSGIRQFPVRVKCATLPWHTLNAAIAAVDEPVSTE